MSRDRGAPAKRVGSLFYAMGLGVASATPLLAKFPFAGMPIVNPVVSWGGCAIFLAIALTGVIRGETLLPAGLDGRRPKMALLGFALVCLALTIITFFALVLHGGNGQGTAFLLIFVFPFAQAGALLANGIGVGLAELSRIRLPIHVRSAERTLLIALFAAAGFAFIGDGIQLSRTYAFVRERGESFLGMTELLGISVVEFGAGVALLLAAALLVRRRLDLAQLAGYAGISLALGVALYLLFDLLISVRQGAYWTLDLAIGQSLAPLPWVLAGIGLHRYLRAAEAR